MTTPLTPRRSRPQIEKSYGIPEEKEGMLPWEFVDAQMAAARNYWLATVRPDGRPHAMPVWGVWLEGVFYCSGGPTTRWNRNLAANPNLVVHLESGDNVVILEGQAQRVSDPALVARIDAAYLAKYDTPHGEPMWALRPRLAFAWTDYPTTVTRFQFDQ